MDGTRNEVTMNPPNRVDLPLVELQIERVQVILFLVILSLEGCSLRTIEDIRQPGFPQQCLTGAVLLPSGTFR